MNKIICPHCKKEVDIPEALSHQIKEKEYEKAKLEYDAKLEKQRQEAERIAALKAKSQIEKATIELKNKNKTLEEEKIRSEKRQAEREEKIKEDTARKSSEDHRLEKLQWEKQKADMQKSLEEAQRKGKQGSQQLQGEVMELDLEQKLKSLFPYDELKPVAKGKEGADLIQYVKNKYGKTGSIILWEFKRTKNWDKKWLIKLREDARSINANEAIIVSETLPDQVKVYEKIDGIWVTGIKHAFYLARILREMGLRIAIAKSAVQHTDESLKKLHDYVLSEKFRHKIDRHREQTEMSIKLLEKRKKDDEKYYRDQKTLLDILANNTPQIYFDLQEILPALPSISSGT